MSTSNDVEDDGTTAGRQRRRRGSHRAASRPAGPPVDAPAPPDPPSAAPSSPGDDAAAGEVVLADDRSPDDGSPGDGGTGEVSPDDGGTGEVEAAPGPVRRRARTALPVFQSAADDAPADEEPAAAPADEDTAPAPDPAPAAQPDPPVTAPARRRRRAASRPAGPPVDAPVVPGDPAPRAAEQPATEEPAAEPAADEVAVDEPTPDDAVAELAAPDGDGSPDAADEAADDAADDVADQASDDDADDDTDEEGAPRSRRGRRRRGGRGRRRRAGDDGTDDADEASTDQASTDQASTDRPATDGTGADGTGADGTGAGAGPQATAADEVPGDGAAAGEDDEDGPEGEDADEDATDEGSAGSSRRRRRRRRRGGPAGGDADADEEAAEAEAPAATSRRSRSRRSSAREGSEPGDVTAVKGSTRLEAKRQRRRDGRDGGRRPRVLSEAEFLARRESVERTMVVRVAAGRSQVAVLEDGVLVEHYAARKQQTSMIGNVHLGRVQNVLPSMEAAFVDIGRGRNAVLYAGEVDWDAAGLSGQAKKIESALKSGDPVLVQVSKDPVGHKGARLTSQVSLPGRYLVYVPGGSMTGISRKLPDTERSRLKSILKEVVPEEAGVIVRTAAEGASEEELRRDVERLAAQWEQISARAKQVSPPTLLHGEPDLVIKVVRDVFNEDFARLVVEGEEAWAAIEPYVASVAPDLAERVSRWEDDADAGAGGAFARFRVDEQIAKALERKVWLPSGGSLVIDRTEAMTVVDVNTGRFTGSGGNLEETVTRNNLEAAEEIVRQLRLRDIGGIVVVDFIDMVLESNRDLVLRRLVECLGRDRSKHQVAEVTSLGLVQMTRKRVGQGLLETFSEPCEHCAGRGVVVHEDLSAGGDHGGHHQHGGSGSGSGGGGGGRGGRGERQDGRQDGRGDQPRPSSRDQPRDQAREQSRDQVREQVREPLPEPAAKGRDRAAPERPPAAEPEPTGPRSREEAARDAVREAMNGIAMATLRPHRPEGAPAGAPSPEAAALLAALGTSAGPAADDVAAAGPGAPDPSEPSGAAFTVDEVEVVTTVVVAAPEPVEPAADRQPDPGPDEEPENPEQR